MVVIRFKDGGKERTIIGHVNKMLDYTQIERLRKCAVLERSRSDAKAVKLKNGKIGI